MAAILRFLVFRTARHIPGDYLFSRPCLSPCTLRYSDRTLFGTAKQEEKTCISASTERDPGHSKARLQHTFVVTRHFEHTPWHMGGVGSGLED